MIDTDVKVKGCNDWNVANDDIVEAMVGQLKHGGCDGRMRCEAM